MTSPFNGKIGFGSTPAMLLIDFINAYVARESPFFSEGVIGAVEAAQELLACCRASRVPVIHVRSICPDKVTGWFSEKVPGVKLLTEGSWLTGIVDALRPIETEVVITKAFPSCFFGTPLASVLTLSRSDTLLLAGCSTSGCVRAAAVDSIQHGYRVAVVEECVGDRDEQAHRQSLRDIDAKYADVVSVVSAMNYVGSLARQVRGGAETLPVSGA